MKKLKNVIYILTPNSYVHYKNGNIVIEIKDSENKQYIPIHNIESIVFFAQNNTITSHFLKESLYNNISIYYVDSYNNFIGKFQGPVNGNVLLRTKQYKMSETEEGINIARNIIYGKILNSKLFLQRAGREREEKKAQKLTEAVKIISEYTSNLKDAENVSSIIGIEGCIASVYFSVFEQMQTVKEDSMLFEKRTKHPPRNRMNSLLSFIYTLCKIDCETAIECVGLDPQVGFLHSLRSGRPSLALDLMEELRAPLCDRFAISLTNKKQIKADDFKEENGRFLLTDKARKMILQNWQNRKKEEIIHPYLDEKIQIGLIPYAQAQLLASHIRGDINEYPPFIWR